MSREGLINLVLAAILLAVPIWAHFADEPFIIPCPPRSRSLRWRALA